MVARILAISGSNFINPDDAALHFPPRNFDLCSLKATQRLATSLAQAASPPLLIALNGTLGAGKTQFVRFTAEALNIPKEEVTSPTYVLLQRYRGREVVYHFDFYRLKSEAEVIDLGVDELLEQPVIVFIEWASKFPKCLPDDFLSIHLEPADGKPAEFRRAICNANGPRSAVTLDMIATLFSTSCTE